MRDLVISFPNGKKVECPYGTRIDKLLQYFTPCESPIIAAFANNQIVSLGMRLEVNTCLYPVQLFSQEGSAIYRRSLAFLLAMAAKEVLPEYQLQIGHSLGYGYYYTFLSEEIPTEEEIKTLDRRMRDIVKNDEAIIYYYKSYADSYDYFLQSGQEDTILLLEHSNSDRIPIYECRGFLDLAVSPLVSNTSVLTSFELMQYENGFLLRFPSTKSKGQLEPFIDSPKIFSVYKEYKRWGKMAGIKSVGQLNKISTKGEIKDFIQVAEAFQNKKLAEIADTIYKNSSQKKIVLIAGPSSSGKTTTAKRLSIFLKVMGLEPVAIGLDDYFLGTEFAPKDENGDYDFEGLDALDVAYFNQQLVELLNGKEVEIPIFDFKAGARREPASEKEAANRRIRLTERTILVIEGIHGLNDALSLQVPADNKFKLYVSALTQLNLDDHNRIPTSDNRLIRRMVRDSNFRNHTAAQTINMWPKVQRGERKHIFPFQDCADVAFNSALDYELAILKVFAEPLLRSVKPTMKEYTEASRILSFLENFSPLPSHYVPNQSILREFIGGSEFKY